MLPGEFKVRQVTETEAGILTEIHAKCFPNYWNQEAFTDFFSVKNTFAYLVEAGAVPVAMLVYRATFEQADVLTIAVLPEFRRRGIARQLVEMLIKDCREQGVEKIFLEVEVGNDHAIKLYEDNGFKQVSRRKLYYQQLDGSLTDGLVMQKKLT